MKGQQILWKTAFDATFSDSITKTDSQGYATTQLTPPQVVVFSGSFDVVDENGITVTSNVLTVQGGNAYHVHMTRSDSTEAGKISSLYTLSLKDEYGNKRISPADITFRFKWDSYDLAGVFHISMPVLIIWMISLLSPFQLRFVQV